MAKYLGMTVLVLLLAAVGAVAQQPGGPAAGTTSSCVRHMMRMAPFEKPTASSIPISAEPRHKVRHKPSEIAPDHVPASAPEGSNFTLDISATTSPQTLPPIALTNFRGISETPSFPPDPVVAAGPQHLVAAVNRQIHVFSKDGTSLDSVDAAIWYSTLVPGCTPFDPRVLYDHSANRFLMLWHHYTTQPEASYYLLSVSETDDPTGVWTSWALPGDMNGSTPSGTWADNGCLGFDSTAVYITSDQYAFSTGAFTDERVRIIPKSALYAQPPGQLTWTDFWHLGALLNREAFRVRPSVVHGPTSAYYLLEVPDIKTGTTLILYRINNPLSSPSITATQVPVTAWSRCPDAGQPGGGTLLDTRGSSLEGEVQMMNGSLWGVFSVANPLSTAYSSIRYVRINLASNTASEDITFGSQGYWYIYPAIAVDQDGNAAISFTRSGASEYPGCFFTWRLAADGPSLRPSSPLQGGWAHYERLDGSGANRWGDYSAAVLDPVDKNAFWLAGEYTEGPDTWGTWIMKSRLVPYAGQKAILSTRTLDFGSVDVDGRSDTMFVNIWNGGTQTLTISGASVATAAFKLCSPPPFPATVGMFDSLRLALVFSPTGTAPFTDTMVVTSDDASEPRSTVTLCGTGVSIAQARPLALYAVQATRTSDNLDSLDQAGNVIRVAPMEIAGVHSLTIGPSSEQIIGALAVNHGTEIVRVDASSGRCYSSSTFPIHDVTAITFSHPDTLICGTSSGEVYRVIPATSGTTILGGRPGIGFSGLVTHPGSNRVWASAGFPAANDTLYLINTRAGTVLPVGTTGFKVRTTALSMAPDGGLYGLIDNALVRIDTMTGKGTFITLFPVEGLWAIALRTDTVTTGVTAPLQSWTPISFALLQNYPNPFNPRTTIEYELPHPAHVTITVFNILGEQVATLVDEQQSSGRFRTEWDATRFASGVYWYRITAASFSSTRRMLLLK